MLCNHDPYHGLSSSSASSWGKRTFRYGRRIVYIDFFFRSFVVELLYCRSARAFRLHEYGTVQPECPTVRIGGCGIADPLNPSAGCRSPGPRVIVERRGYSFTLPFGDSEGSGLIRGGGLHTRRLRVHARIHARSTIPAVLLT